MLIIVKHTHKSSRKDFVLRDLKEEEKAERRGRETSKTNRLVKSWIHYVLGFQSFELIFKLAPRKN